VRVFRNRRDSSTTHSHTKTKTRNDTTVIDHLHPAPSHQLIHKSLSPPSSSLSHLSRISTSKYFLSCAETRGVKSNTCSQHKETPSAHDALSPQLLNERHGAGLNWKGRAGMTLSMDEGFVVDYISRRSERWRGRWWGGGGGRLNRAKSGWGWVVRVCTALCTKIVEIRGTCVSMEGFSVGRRRVFY